MKENHSDRPVRVGLISLGCAKNMADAEIMLGTLLKDGMQITNDAVQADVVIVNTCSFIDSAQQESVDAILESAEVREANQRGQALIVSGCLPQRFRAKLPGLLPEVDAFMGIDQVTKISQIVQTAYAKRQEKLKTIRSRRRKEADPQPARNKQQPNALSVPQQAEPCSSSLVDVSPRPSFI